jgi:tetraacyldisaccharide 4'-kinase
MRFDFTRYWYRPKWHLITLSLLPFSWLFGLCVVVRRGLYRIGIIKKYHFSVPVIVVGNITVGGTGKTPFVIELAAWLQTQGYRPGIVSRGVGGKKQGVPYRVRKNDTAEDVGDEALLLKQRTDCPLVICVDRAAAVRDLLQHTHCNIVISDDGLQHYRLGRAMEIVLVDAVRGMGNRCLLPAGPLREPTSRLQHVDFVVINGGSDTDDYTMSFIPTQLVSLSRPQQKISLADFANRTVHAVAGIGHPERFFTMLNQAGLHVIQHVFPDHYLYQSCDIHFADSFPIIMTEKDAVKCRSFADERCWYLNIIAKINVKLEQALLSRLIFLEAHHEYEKNFT